MEGDEFNHQLLKKADYAGNTAVHLAAVGPEPKILREVLERGASVHVRNRANNTPLYLAEKMVASGTTPKSEECVGLLKEAGGHLWLENEESMANSRRGSVGGRENGNGVNAKPAEEKLTLEVEAPLLGDPETFLWEGATEKVRQEHDAVWKNAMERVRKEQDSVIERARKELDAKLRQELAMVEAERARLLKIGDTPNVQGGAEDIESTTGKIVN